MLAPQVDTELLPAEENPWGSAFTKVETPLTRETGRVVDVQKARFWKVSNPAKRHVYSGARALLRTWGCSCWHAPLMECGSAVNTCSGP